MPLVATGAFAKTGGVDGVDVAVPCGLGFAAPGNAVPARWPRSRANA
jgi:hypothetical protein